MSEPSNLRQRLDLELVDRKLARSRSQAEDIINRGYVILNGKTAAKPAQLVDSMAAIKVWPKPVFVSRAGEKLYSVIEPLKLEFKNKVVLDVGSSTGGFTDVAIREGAKKVVAVDVGTEQLHPSLRGNRKIELHEQTDIRNFQTKERFGVVVIDVSFISLRQVLPSIAKLCSPSTEIIAMVKPQFEAQANDLKHKGVIKNDKIRREILKQFEIWVRGEFKIAGKADSKVAGSKGNLERFYKLHIAVHTSK